MQHPILCFSAIRDSTSGCRLPLSLPQEGFGDFFAEQRLIGVDLAEGVAHHLGFPVVPQRVQIKFCAEQAFRLIVSQQQRVVDAWSQQMGLKAQEQPAFSPLGLAMTILTMFS